VTPVCADPAVEERVVSMGLTTFGHGMVGTAVATVSGGRWSLTLLAPGGVEMFTASGPPTVVATGIEAWRPWLEGMPFERDLWLTWGDVPEGGCTLTDGGSLTRVGTGVRYVGPAGRARRRDDEGRVEVRDARRHYRLTLVDTQGVTGAP